MWFWDYTHLKEPFAYGPDDTYKAAAEFLQGGPVEDWGCGTAYARRFFPNGYIGVDAAHHFADRIVNLETYMSKTEGILLRHVLEHNENWEKILANALLSAPRLAIVVFTPLGEETKIINWTENARGKVPDISLSKQDLVRFFPSYTEREFRTGIAYGKEVLFCVSK